MSPLNVVGSLALRYAGVHIPNYTELQLGMTRYVFRFKN
jgi:hypothetical protein